MKALLGPLIAIVICMLLMVGLSPLLESEPETISNSQVQDNPGTYFLYRTEDSQEYLTFWENFDEERFEIIDISTSMQAYKSGEFYIITYREKK